MNSFTEKVIRKVERRVLLLFQLYEFSRQQLLDAMRAGEAKGTENAIEILTEIRDAWSQIGSQSVASE